MAHSFSELVIGGVLLAPFVTHLLIALAVIIILRPLLHAVGFARIFSHESIAVLSLYVTILGSLMLLF